MTVSISRRQPPDKQYLLQVGNRLRTQRLKLGYTIAEMSHKSGMVGATISYIERGETNVGISKIYTLANTYEMDLGDLI